MRALALLSLASPLRRTSPSESDTLRVAMSGRPDFLPTTRAPDDDDATQVSGRDAQRLAGILRQAHAGAATQRVAASQAAASARMQNSMSSDERLKRRAQHAREVYAQKVQRNRAAQDASAAAAQADNIARVREWFEVEARRQGYESAKQMHEAKRRQHEQELPLHLQRKTIVRTPQQQVHRIVAPTACALQCPMRPLPAPAPTPRAPRAPHTYVQAHSRFVGRRCRHPRTHRHLRHAAQMLPPHRATRMTIGARLMPTAMTGMMCIHTLSPTPDGRWLSICAHGVAKGECAHACA